MAKTYQARIEELVSARRKAWAAFRTPCVIAEMTPGRQAEVALASEAFKQCGRGLTEILVETGRSFTLRDGTVVRLNAYGDGPAILRPCVESRKRIHELDQIAAKRTLGAGAVA